MKVTLITVCYNAEKTIAQTIKSVKNQVYELIEYIVVDGASYDNTLNIINDFKEDIDIIISERDYGMYDAINKAIKLAGGDIVGILNADDEFSNNFVISNIVKTFERRDDIDCVIGDISFVNSESKVIRKYSSRKWKPSKFTWGFMPPHPSFYCRKSCFEVFGYYKIDYDIAADYELLIRFFAINKIKYCYIPMDFVQMKMGGKSTKSIKSTFKINREIRRACLENGLKTNYIMLYSKYLKKVFEFF